MVFFLAQQVDLKLLVFFYPCLPVLSLPQGDPQGGRGGHEADDQQSDRPPRRLRPPVPSRLHRPHRKVISLSILLFIWVL